MAPSHGTAPRPRRRTRSALMLALEPRLMYDGAAAATAAAAAAETAAHAAGDRALIPAAATAPVQVRAANPAADGGQKEAVFIDTSVSNWQALVAQVETTRPGAAIELIDSGQSGLAQMAVWAEANSGFNAIHVLSPGAEGGLHLGTDTLTDASLSTASPATKAELAEVGHALAAGGGILVYGSSLAAGADGLALITDLAADTGAVVVAADHAVGSADHSAADGVWSLNVTVAGDASGGSAVVRPLALTGYLGALGVGDVASPASPAPVDVAAADSALDGGKLELVFVDTSVAGWQGVVASVASSRPGVGIELIDGTVSGLAQMVAWADTHHGYDAIHVVSRGAEATLRLGSDTLTDASLANTEVGIDLQVIAASLKSGGQILFYGADIGAGADGRAFLGDLAATAGGTVAVTASATVEGGGHGVLDSAAGVAPTIPLAALDLADTGAHLDGAAASMAIQPTLPTDNPSQIVVVDGTVVDWRTLIAGMDPTIPVIVLEPGASGQGEAQQLAGLLRSYHNLDAIHLVTEGRTGGILLGSVGIGYFDVGNIGFLTQAIAGALKPGGDLLLYGCSVAGSAYGQAFVDELAADIGNGVVVAASTDKTGPTALGGDWTLEYSTGTVDTVLPFTLQGMQDISHCLGCVSKVDSNGYNSIYVRGQEVVQFYYSRSIGSRQKSYYNGSRVYSIYGSDVSNSINNRPTRQFFTNASSSIPQAITYLSNNLTQFQYVYSHCSGTLSGSFVFTGTHTSSGSPLSFPLSTSPQAIDSAIVASSSNGWNGGFLTVDLSTGSDGAHDSLAVINNSGNITVSGSTVSYSGTAIATIDSTDNGGIGHSLTLNFTSGATSTGVQALLRAIGFASTGSSTNLRYLLFNLMDGSQVSSRLTEFIAPTNTTPAFTGGVTSLTFAHDTTNTIVADLHVADIDSGQTETWTLTSGPSHGTIGFSSGSSATASSGASDITPGGTITYTPTAGYVGSDSVTFQADDGHGGTVSRTLTITVQGPTISGGTAAQTVNDNVTSATPLSGVTVGDGVSESISVTVTVNGTTLGDLGNYTGWTRAVSGGKVTYVQTFTSTTAADTALHALTWTPVAHAGAVGSTSTATEIDVTVAAGSVSATDSTNTVKVSYVNTSPTVTAGGGGSVTSTQGAAVTIDSALTFNDVDNGGSGNWGGGSLRVQVTANADSSHDTFVLPASGGGITLSGGTVKDGGTTIGTLTQTSGTNWTVVFTSGVTNTQVSDLARAFQLSATGTTSALARTVTFTATDGAAVAVTASDTVNMILGPTVSAITRDDGHIGPSNASQMTYQVTFSEAVTGVDASDFTLIGTDTAVGMLAVVSTSDNIHYVVTVSNVSGNGTLRLDLNSSGTGIAAASGGAAIVGGYTGGDVVTIDHTAPVIGNLNGDSAVYLQGQSAMTLDSGAAATVTEANIASGGTLRVSITANGAAGEDTLLVKAGGGITTATSGGTVTVLDGGTAIGTYTATSGSVVNNGNDLVITLAGGDTAAQVADLIHALAYANTSGPPGLAARTIAVTLTDAAGNVSTAADVTMGIDALPVLGSSVGMPGPVSRTQTGTVFDSGLSLSDTDNNWSGGTLTVQITSGADATHDSLTLPTSNGGGVWINGTTVMAGGNTIATASAASVTGGTAWTFTFASQVTNAQASALAAAIELQVSAGGALGSRTIAVSVADNHGLQAGPRYDAVSVVAEPAVSGGSAHAVNDTATTTPLAGVTISDGLSEGVTVSVSFASGRGDFGAPTGWTVGTTAGTTTYSQDFASVSAANTALAALTFTPTAHVGNVGSSGTVTFTVSARGDSSGLQTGNDSSASAVVTYVNTTPTVTAGNAHTATATQGAATVIDSALTFSDVDNGGSGNWGGGMLQVLVTANADSGHDTFILPASGGGITLSGTTVKDGGTTIGTLTQTSATNWTIAFTGGVTNAQVNDLAQAIQLAATGTTSALARTVTFSAIDGAAATATATATVDVPLGPSVTTITRDGGAAALTNGGVNGTVSFDVSFDAPVTGVTAADFQAVNGTNVSSGAITVAPSGTASGGGYTTWVVTVHGVQGDGSGTLGLTLAAQATSDIKDTSAITLFGTTPTSSATFTIDTTAPAQPGISGLTAATDTGISSSDGITSDATPVVTGTAEAGSTVSVYDGATLLGTTTASGGGTWSFTVPSALSSGGHSLTVKATDTAGNVSLASAAYSVTIDTTAPAQPGISGLTAATDTGISSSDGITSDATPVVTGTAEAGSTVSVYDGATLLGTTTASGGGTWSFTVPGALSSGGHSLTVKATDTAGNVSLASAASSVTIDTTAPAQPGISGLTAATDTGSSSSDGITSDATPVVTGTAEAGSTVSVYDGATLLGTTTASGGGTWSFTVPSALSSGGHSLTVTATDAAGNVSLASAASSVTIDTTAPAQPGISGLTAATDTGSSSSDGITSDATPVVTGTAEAGSTVSVYDGTTLLGTTTASGGGTWSFTVPAALSSGGHSLTVTATDAAGNVSLASAASSVTIDTTAPAQPGISGLTAATDTGSSSSDGITSDATPVVTGTAEAGSTVSVYDGATLLGTTTASGGGTWSFTVPSALSSGGHSLTVTATDTAGNVSLASAAYSVTIDTTAPAQPGISGLTAATDTGSSSSDGITSDATPVVTGTAEAGSTVSVYDGATLLGTTTASGGGTWSFTVPGALSSGGHSLTVTATDTAGNVSLASAASSVTIDTTAPAQPGISGLTAATDTGSSSSDGITSDATPVVTGTAEAGSTVSVYDGTTLLGTTTASGGGTWSFTVPAALSSGGHSLTVKAADTAGNVSLASAASSVTIDTTAPAQPGISGLTAATDTGISSSDGITSDATPVVTGTAEAGSTVSVYDGATLLGTTTASGGGTWSFTVPSALSSGGHSLTVTATDAAGNVSLASAAYSVTIDTTAPSETVNSLGLSNDSGASASDFITNSALQTISGTLSTALNPGEFVQLSLDGGATWITATTSGTRWSASAQTLLPGSHILEVRVFNTAGNVGATRSQTYILDTTAPAQPGISGLTAATDTGSSSSDGITSDATPVVTGTAEAGSTVSVYDGTTLLGSTTASGGGTWSFTVPAALSSGGHSLTVTATDAAGNVSLASAASSVTIDTTAPAQPGISGLTAATDTGSSSSDGITSDATPVVTGTAEAGSTVSVYDGATLLGTTTASGGGTWSFTVPSALSSGGHSLTVTATDTAGNVSLASAAYSVTIDTTAPAQPGISGLTAATDTGSSSSDGITSDATPVVTGTAEAGSTVSVYDGATLLGTTTASGGGTWSFTVPGALSSGGHSLTVTATDTAGNVSLASAASSVTIDTTAPAQPGISGLTAATDTGSSSSDGITSDATPVVTGTAEAGSTVSVYDGTTLLGTTTASGGGTWSFTVPGALSSGGHSLTVTATDTAGNVSLASAASSVTIDTTAPAQPGISGLTAATDTGSSSSDGITSDGITSDATPVVTGTAEAGSTVSVYDGAALLGTTTASGGGTWSFTVPGALSSGGHSLTVTATDTAGNVSLASAASSVTIDTTAPAQPGISGSDGITSNRQPVMTGTAEAGSTVSVYDGTTLLGTTTASGGGTWSFAAPTALADGRHTIQVTATDTAGNVSPLSTALSVRIAPTTTGGVAARSWSGSGQNSIVLPAGVFSAPAGDTLTYRAVLVNADGSAAGNLPTWISIDAATGTLSGSVPVALSGTLHIQVIASDASGDSASVVVDLSYQGAPTPVVLASPPSVAVSGATTTASSEVTATLVTIVRDGATSTSTGITAPAVATTTTAAVAAPVATSVAAPSTVSAAAGNSGIGTGASPGAARAVTEVVASGGVINYSLGAQTLAPLAGGGDVQMTAVTADGHPLPTWLHFDAGTGTLVGQPPAGETGTVDVVVIARDAQGREVRTYIRLQVGTASGQRQGALERHDPVRLAGIADRGGTTIVPVDFTPQRAPVAKPGLSAQLRSAHHTTEIARQGALLRAAEHLLRRV